MTLNRGRSRLGKGSGLASYGRLGGGRGLRTNRHLNTTPAPLTCKPKGTGLSFEEEVVELYNNLTGERARRQRGSGAQWFRPGDVLTAEFLIECKEYARPVIKREWIEGNVADSTAYPGRTPLLAFKHKPSRQLWLVVDTKDIPPTLDLILPDVLVQGAQTQATIKDPSLDRFQLTFASSDTLYVACQPEEIFCYFHLFRG